MLKQIKSYIKLQVLSGMANPSPPVGPTLGQKGLNIMDFCKSFNEKTSNLEKGMPIPVVISVYSDRSFSFIIKSPPVSFLLKKILSIKKGVTKPNHDTILYINKNQVLDIVKLKLVDMNTYNIDSIFKTILGTARSMGILLKE